MKTITIFALLLVITLTGCMVVPYPHKVTDLPGVQGVVVWQDSQQPAQDVRIVLSQYRTDVPALPDLDRRQSELIAQRSTMTLASGKFAIPEEDHWCFFKLLILAPVDLLPEFTELSLTYEDSSSGALVPFSDAGTASFAPRASYCPVFLLRRAPRYGPFDFKTLTIGAPNNSLHTDQKPAALRSAGPGG